MLLSELASKDVINDHDGSKIGRINDVEIDIATGKITYAKIYSRFRFSNIIGKKDETSIAWNKLLKIGNDVIIVENEHHDKKNKTKVNDND